MSFAARFPRQRWPEVDDEVRSWLAEAYEVGAQRHLAKDRAAVRPRPPAPPGTG